MFFAAQRYFRKAVATGLVMSALGILLPAQAVAAGGISIQGTRIVYPFGMKQTSVILRNSSQTDSFLVQSWVEDAKGRKSKDFVVTPPLYVSKPGNGNTLRLMYAGGPLPEDRETLYYFVTKAIPAVEKKTEAGQGRLILAGANSIKLFVRPAGLKPDIKEAPSQLTFRRSGGLLEISNPTPYHLTLTEIKAGSRELKTIMVPPAGRETIDLPAGSGNTLSFRTINDHGALTDIQTRSIH